MKRGRDDGKIENLDTANCLMLLSKVGETKAARSDGGPFQCKTCNRQFTSFQALGGHRASHKKPKLTGADLAFRLPSSNKTHPCPVCGLEFAIGQALGGHMRKHRAAASDRFLSHDLSVQEPLPVLRNSNNKRINLGLDLNLTPLENDLNLSDFSTPILNCFI